MRYFYIDFNVFRKMLLNTGLLYILLIIVSGSPATVNALLIFRDQVLYLVLYLIIGVYICKESFWNNLFNGYYNKYIYKYFNFIILLDIFIQPFHNDLRSVVFVIMLLYRLISKKLISTDINFIWDYGWLGAIVIRLVDDKWKFKKLIIWHVLAYKQLLVLDDELRKFLEAYYKKKVK